MAHAAILDTGAMETRERRFVDRGALPVYAVAAALASFVVATLAAGVFDHDRALFAGFVPALVIFLLTAFAIRWLGFDRLAGLIEALLLFLLIAFLAPLAATILAATNLPLADAMLAQSDRILFGFDRPAVMAWFDAIPALRAPTVAIYNSLAVQPFVLLALFFWFRRATLAWTLLSAWAIALALSVAIFPLFPAHGVPPYVLDWIAVIDGSRAGTLRTLDAATLTGIITFPSFHAAGATMLAWSFARLHRYAWPMVALNAAMFLSALLVGGHYLVDLVAGTAVAAAAVLIAQRWQRRLTA